MVAKYKESILQNKKIIYDLTNQKDSLCEENNDLESQVKRLLATQLDLENKNNDLHNLLTKVKEDHQKEVGDLKASLSKVWKITFENQVLPNLTMWKEPTTTLDKVASNITPRIGELGVFGFQRT